MKKENLFVILTGVVIGIAALVLTALGNPANMGFCIACFERDIAGAVGLHSAAKVQYVRPEIIGLVLGSFLMALASKEWKARAGSSPALRFVQRRLTYYKNQKSRETPNVPSEFHGFLFCVLLISS